MSLKSENSFRSNARSLRVVAALVLAMTAGASVLMLLDRQGPPAGAFSLASYTTLDSVDNTISYSGNAYAWNRIEICWSGTVTGDINTLAGLEGKDAGDINFHFIVCNGVSGKDGLIEACSRWDLQRSAMPDDNWYGSSETIRICVVGDGVKAMPTDTQIQRTKSLVESLSRKFDIESDLIIYPENWQL